MRKHGGSKTTSYGAKSPKPKSFRARLYLNPRMIDAEIPMTAIKVKSIVSLNQYEYSSDSIGAPNIASGLGQRRCHGNNQQIPHPSICRARIHSNPLPELGPETLDVRAGHVTVLGLAVVVRGFRWMQ